MKTLHIDLPVESSRHYPIYVGNDLLAHSDLLSPFIRHRPVCIVSNETIAPLYLKTLEKALVDAQHVFSVILKDGESFKNQQSLTHIHTALLEHHFERQGILMALGGGVVGDITGFAAATYQRGIDFIQVPTTLLAMVDSSVGGKTAINHALGKNMIGAFYQPKMVLMDLNTLETLPKREFAAGMAEVIKYGAILDADFLHALHNENFLKNHFNDAILQSVQMKAYIVQQDEREKGLRALLNFGHTFGHAIEALLGFGRFLHGEAVGVGMLMAAQFSYHRGYLNQNDVLLFKNILEKNHLPLNIPKINVDALIQKMKMDKKVENEKIRLVVLEKLGKAIIINDASDAELQNAILPFVR